MMKKKYYNNRLTMSKGSMNMKIIKVINDEDKKKITRAILEALPEWFGIVEAREEYILDSVLITKLIANTVFKLNCTHN